MELLFNRPDFYPISTALFRGIERRIGQLKQFKLNLPRVWFA
jgi:hypothetical protein